MSPLVGRSNPPMRFRSVDLPEPEGPTIATMVPFPISRLTFSSAVALRLPSKTFETLLIVINSYSLRPIGLAFAPLIPFNSLLMVQHQIDYYYRNRDVHPHGKSPFGNS